MTRPLRAALSAPILAFAVLVAACSGSPGSGSPSDTVRQAFQLVDDGNFSGLSGLACEAQKGTIQEQFDLAAGLGQLPAGFDLGQLFQAITLDMSGVTFTDSSVTGDSATVQIAGSLRMVVDAARFKEILRQLAQQQGQPIDEAALDAGVAQMQSVMQAVPVNETVDLVREGGAWKICDPA
jgi:hypothetical protein